MGHLNRRELLQCGIAGTTLSQIGLLPGVSKTALASGDAGTFGRARSVIVMFCWGGMSHLDTFDMKSRAGSDIRGEFQSIPTSVPGIRITEHLPLMARQMQHLAVVRSVHHGSADHRKAGYWNLTGHMPTGAEGGVVPALLPSRKDWPSLGAQVAIAMRDDSRYRHRKQVRRLRPEEVEPDKSIVDWSALQVVRKVRVSTDIVGPGRFSTGSFGKQDGFTNRHSVELIGMIASASAASVSLTRQATGPRADFSKMVAGDGTAGDWGSDTHGRGGPLWLIGDGEPREAHAGFGCHANKFITLNLDEVRKRHFKETVRAFVLTCRAGINGDPGVHPTAAGQAGIWLDGKPVAISRILGRDDRSQKLEAIIRPGAKYLTLAMLNGNGSTFYDDIALRDVDLHEVEGELPEPAQDQQLAKDAAQEVTEDLAANLPRTISIPYPLADRGLLNGQYGGFLGLEYDPVFVHPGQGAAFQGVSPNSGTIDLTPRVSRRRLAERGLLLEGLDSGLPWAKSDEHPEFRHKASQDQAVNMLLSPDVQLAFDLSKEPTEAHDLYGDHVAGQSTLLGRRLTDAGVPLVTVNLSVGDLNGSQGDNWDTHGNNFNRLKNDLLPRWDRAASALIQDLVQSGRIDDTLVVFLTEFGRTPKINAAAGRDHFPNCYTVLFAGAGVQGGSVLGKSDKIGSRPIEAACTPEDIHATVLHSLGVAPDFEIHDPEDRPFVMCEGTPLSIFSQG
ncbi:MAG: DUF1501 domain-containing protein [Planctomycetes bacterium]|nr:DUF1501 domain-containing protein [Planctomycetota bacterium]